MNEAQSALHPMGPAAARIALLADVLFIGAAVVMLIVAAALWLALRGGPGVRAALAGKRAIVVGGIVFPVVTLVALLAYTLWAMRASLGPAAVPPALRIAVAGEQWWWRVTYLPAGSTPVASANEIRIPVGAEVEFILDAADVIHSFWVPALGGKMDMIPGRTNRLRLTADRPGVYRGQCAEYCGGPHALMAFEVVAMPADDFAAWLRAEAGPAAEPKDQAARRGRALFLAAGCGACHTVRGTAAAGTIGPDLTRVGARRMIAAATLPTLRQDLARFIAEGDHVKPGNLMPPFRIFAADELDAIATWLAGLR